MFDRRVFKHCVPGHSCSAACSDDDPSSINGNAEGSVAASTSPGGPGEYVLVSAIWVFGTRRGTS